tara:strand:+ start:123 stop:356 length:234 start_codon:yes stop_codon:yes gene_type:complete
MITKNENWNGLKPLEPDAVEKIKIEQLLEHNPRLDYLMALLLVKSSDEDLDKIIKDTTFKKSLNNTSNIIKDAFTIN